MSATPEELAAVLAALAARRGEVAELSAYELWRRKRRAALRRRA